MPGPAPDPTQFGTAAEFQEGLRALVDQANLTDRQIAERSNGEIGPTTVWTNRRKQDGLASQHAVKHIVRACTPEVEAKEAETLWLAAHERIQRGPVITGADPASSPAAQPRPTTPRPDITSLWNALRGRPRWVLAITTVLVVALAALVPALLSYNSHCGTFDTALERTSDGQECVGATDPQGHPGVFGPKLKPVMELIARENDEAMNAPGPYVTIAFMGPLTSDEPRVVHQLEGAYTAQAKANNSKNYPKIRLVMANQGAREAHWDNAVSALLTMVDDPHRLLAVAGLGLSQKESVLAARKLAAGQIPMIGDIITADGFNATGAIDGKGDIPGLVQVSPNNTNQLNAIDKWLRTQPKLKTAVLVKTKVTDSGSDDYYTSSLAEAFETRSTIRSYLQAGQGYIYPLDPRSGDTALQAIANNLCGKVIPDMVFYAARQSSLPTFLNKLRQRSCHSKPITVITGSDGAGLRGQDIPALNDPNAPISVVYVPLADPAQLDSSDNLHRGLFQEFKNAFTDHGFPVEHLDTGWAIKSYDAVITAVTAIRAATKNGATLTPELPGIIAVRNHLQLFSASNVVPGASGNFNIDPLTGDRVYDDTHLLRLSRLPSPIPAPQAPTSPPTP